MDCYIYIYVVNFDFLQVYRRGLSEGEEYDAETCLVEEETSVKKS